MKKVIFLIILFFIYDNSFSQSNPETFDNGNQKHVITYMGGILTQYIIQNYSLLSSKNEKIIQQKVIGDVVKTTIDTLFKKYRIFFKDENGNIQVMNLRYQRNAFIEDNKDESKAKIIKTYIMEDQGVKFFVIDCLDLPPYSFLEIDHDKLLENNRTLLYRLTGAKKETMN
ncbi:MAG: hypothetical protein ABI207_05940 [Crocinitomicaceae bacterium]